MANQPANSSTDLLPRELPQELWALVLSWLARSKRAKGDLAAVREVCQRFRGLATSVAKHVAGQQVPIGDCLNSVSRAEWMLAHCGNHHPLEWWEDHFDSELVTAAAKEGKLEVVKLLREKGHSWDEYTCAYAAKGGHLKVLQWLRSHGDLSCPWNESTCAHAAWGGHLEVLQWLRDTRLHGRRVCPWGERVCANAAKRGHLKVLQWLRSHGDLSCPWNESTCALAALNGHLEVLKWARSNGCGWDARICSIAALDGHLEVLVLKWARLEAKPPCPRNERTCANAAKNDRLEVLKWARANGCKWDRWVCAWAALNGHLDVLKWAQANGCPWDGETYTKAAQNGHLEVPK